MVLFENEPSPPEEELWPLLQKLFLSKFVVYHTPKSEIFILLFSKPRFSDLEISRSENRLDHNRFENSEKKK